MKGVYKGFKHIISQIFVVKEREMEIGNPTDVKHLAHIGWDGSSSGNAPTWMNEFKIGPGPDFASTSVGNSLWSSQGLVKLKWDKASYSDSGTFKPNIVPRKTDLSESTRELDTSRDVALLSSEFAPSIIKKQKHKWNTASSSRSFRVTKSISCFIDSSSVTKPSNPTKLM